MNKLTVIESTLVKENKRRTQEEKELQERVEAKIREAKLNGEHSVDAMKKHIDVSNIIIIISSSSSSSSKNSSYRSLLSK